MNKKIAILSAIIVVGVIALTAGCVLVKNEETTTEIQVPAELPREVIYIPYPLKITIDGKLDDWKNVPSSTVSSGPLPSSVPEENGSFTFSVAADMENFYITMQMPDKNIIAGQHGTDFWNEDSLEFYINASGDLNASKYDLKIFQVNINAADIGNTDPEALTITGTFNSEAKVRGFVFNTENGWGFEASVPLEGLVEVAHGTVIGFQAQSNGASVKDRDVKLIWSKADTSDLSWQNPRLFGQAIFFKLGSTDVPQPKAVAALPTATPTPGPVSRPALVSVNQTGYFPQGTKIALVVSNSTQELDWSLKSSSGETLMSGKTSIKGEDKTSGDFLHAIDFSSFSTPGSGYRIAANELESVPFAIAGGIYSQLKSDAMAYFYHNRSGIPIEAKYAGDAWARPAGHLTDNNVTCYKGIDADGKTWPGCDYILNAAGGWYDAGDFGKYVVNGGISVWTLMNLYEQDTEAFPDGSLSIPENANGVPDLLDEARWEMEFLLSMQVPDGEPLAGMVHHKLHDESWAGMPMVPPSEVNNDNKHEITGTGRYLYPPSTAATLNLAATAAACARIWEQIDPAFAERCLSAAETAWEAARANPALLAGNTPGAGGGNYPDNDITDESSWAAAELFITTGKSEYETALLESPLFGKVEAFEWGRTASLATISLTTVQNNLAVDKQAILKANMLAFADKMIGLQEQDGYSVLIEGNYPWGSNGQILNNMMLMGKAFDLSGDGKYLEAMRLSMDYLMGRNPVNTSYVSGYGTSSMQHPHHRFWANDPANGYPPPPAGAVSGGPNTDPSDPVAINAGLKDLPMSKRYMDDIGSFTTNEVAINWNAPLAWVAAFLDRNSEK